MADKKKYRLISSSPEQPILFGLLTDARDYKITWTLNQALGINLKREEDLIWLHKKLPQKQAFPSFSDRDAQPGPVRLIQNCSSEQIHLPEFKQVDFLLLIYCPPQLLQEARWIDLLRSTKEIRGIYPLEYEPLADVLG